MYLVLDVRLLHPRRRRGAADAPAARRRPNNTLLDPQTYNELFTMHGTTMIFLFVVPIMAGFGNYFVPLMIGARDMAFPKLNALSFWLLRRRRRRLLRLALLQPAGVRLDVLHAAVRRRPTCPTGGVDAWIFLIHLTGLSSLVGAINFYATIANMRAPGMGWGRLPLFVWAILTYAILLILALPVIAGAVTLLLTDRHFGTHFFDPIQRRLAAAVAAPVLVLRAPRGLHHGPAGLRDHLRGPAGLRAQADLRLQGDRRGDGRASPSSACSCGRTTCSRRRARRSCSSSSCSSSFLIAVPTGVKIFNWIATLWRGTIEFTTPLLLRRRLHRHVPHRRHHRHLPRRLPGRLAAAPTPTSSSPTSTTCSMGGAVFAIFAGIYYWFPKITGPDAQRARSASVSFWLMFIGFHVDVPRSSTRSGLDGHAAARLRVLRTSATSSSTT